MAGVLWPSFVGAAEPAFAVLWHEPTDFLQQLFPVDGACRAVRIVELHVPHPAFALVRVRSEMGRYGGL